MLLAKYVFTSDNAKMNASTFAGKQAVLLVSSMLGVHADNYCGCQQYVDTNNATDMT